MNEPKPKEIDKLPEEKGSTRLYFCPKCNGSVRGWGNVPDSNGALWFIEVCEKCDYTYKVK